SVYSFCCRDARGPLLKPDRPANGATSDRVRRSLLSAQQATPMILGAPPGRPECLICRPYIGHFIGQLAKKQAYRPLIGHLLATLLPAGPAVDRAAPPSVNAPSPGMDS